MLTYRYLFLYASGVRPLYASDALLTHEALTEFDRTHNIVDVMIRTESLEKDLIAVLKSVGHHVDERALAALRTAPRTNTSRPRRTGEYYDSATLELVARLFDPFETTKGAGVGLGLTIARSLMEAQNGQIALVHSGDGGTTFRVTLPVAKQGERVARHSR